MISRSLRTATLGACLAVALHASAADDLAATAALQPIKAFAARPALRNVTLSPDGRRIALIVGAGEDTAAVTIDRETPDKPQPLLKSEAGKYEIAWCNWANNTRLLCGLHGTALESRVYFPFSRLIAINADGSDYKLLVHNSAASTSQFHDRVLDWTPDDPDTVLVALDDDLNGYPSVFKVNIYTGQQVIRGRERDPIRYFASDGEGNVRLGWGTRGNNIEYYARLVGEQDWRRLAKVKAFSTSDTLQPIAVMAGKNVAYARGDHEGRTALWEMDLTDETEPKMVFSHPLVDADEPLFTADGRLLGIFYELDRPFIYYVDARARSIMDAVNSALPSKFNFVSDSSDDENVFIIRSYSDVDASTYYVLDVQKTSFENLGTAFPQLPEHLQGRMRTIAYKAADGTEIPGYLTVPLGSRAEQLPLIVMPHGGPIARDSWEYDFVRAFLVSRGYAVLQMNFRGSSGYGWKWRDDAHQDWGGLTYSDILDGTRWAISSGVADPKRVCIVGWSFGGYAALLGAVRNSDLYRCAASIAGVSDLHDLIQDSRAFTGALIARDQIGVTKEKLRADSPLRHVDAIKSPVLLIHGEQDYVVEVGHTQRMASALKKANKLHRAVIIDKGSHNLERPSDRVTLLTELERFLAENMRASAQ